MKNSKDEWFLDWFNEDYLNLYADHNEQEAKQQIEFILQQIPLKTGSTVLDLGCGTGRHSIVFARKQMRVTAVDFSPFLLQEAKKKAAGLNINFILSDIRDFSIPTKFDLILNMFTTFGYFKTDEDNSKILRTIQNHLKTEGHFLIDYLNPVYLEKNLTKHEVKEIKGEEIKIEHQIEHGFVVKKIRFPDRNYEERVKLYSNQDLEKMLKEHGLMVKKKWNSFQDQPWDPSGPRQIILGQVWF